MFKTLGYAVNARVLKLIEYIYSNTKSIYEKEHKQKTLIENKLPKN